jgi:hypothetical protein
MTADYSEGRQDKSGSMKGGEIKIQIVERDGQQVIVIKEQEEAASGADAQQVIEIPAAMLPDLKRAVAAIEESSTEAKLPLAKKSAGFAHESEAEFARILDFYHIDWQYEPRAFPIEWNEQGEATSSFTPDFFLPQHNLYIELTTLKQSLVTKKNRKARRLRELYPEINIKILYAADYRKLVEKFAGSGARQDEEQETQLEREAGKR